MTKRIAIGLLVLLLPLMTGCTLVGFRTQDQPQANDSMPQYETVPDTAENAQKYAAETKRLSIQGRAALERIIRYFAKSQPKDPEWVWAVVEQIHALEETRAQLEGIEVPAGAVEVQTCLVEASRLHIEAARLKLEGKMSGNWLKVWRAEWIGDKGDDQIWAANVLVKEYLATFDID